MKRPLKEVCGLHSRRDGVPSVWDGEGETRYDAMKNGQLSMIMETMGWTMHDVEYKDVMMIEM